MAAVVCQFRNSGAVYTFNAPAASLDLRLVAAGGSGGNGSAAFRGGGGGGGSWVRHPTFAVTPGTSYQITLGPTSPGGSTYGGAGGQTFLATSATPGTPILAAYGGFHGAAGSITSDGAPGNGRGATPGLGGTEMVSGDAAATNSGGTSGFGTVPPFGGQGGSAAGNPGNPPGGGGAGGTIANGVGGSGGRGEAWMLFTTGNTATITHVSAGFTRIKGSYRSGLGIITHLSARARLATGRAVLAGITHLAVPLRKQMGFTKTKSITHTALFSRVSGAARTFSASITHTTKTIMALEARLIPRGGGGGGPITNYFRHHFWFDD